MRSSAYLFVVLGTAPAVFTELIWTLVKRDRTYLSGVEIWTTRQGSDRLRSLLEGGEWEQLEQAVGCLPPVQPDGTKPRVDPGIRIHVFEDEQGVALLDVRSQADARVVNAQLYERLRELRGQLSESVSIIGSLAGGRKTFSAALQTAFTLQAGLDDRLVHVLLDERLESWLQAEGEYGMYSFPTEEWEDRSGVPQEEQVLVYDIPFPRVRWILPRRLSAALDEKGWDEVWPVLHQNRKTEFKAMLIRTGCSTWSYQIRDQETGEVAQDLPLQGRAGALLAGIGVLGEKATQKALIEWLDNNEVGWRPPAAGTDDKVSRPNDISKAATELRSQLRKLAEGLEGFSLPDTGYGMERGITVELCWGESS